MEHNWIIFPYIGKNHPKRLSYFSEGLKPPTRNLAVLFFKIIQSLLEGHAVTLPHFFISIIHQWLIGGFKHFLFSQILGTIIPTDFHIFQDCVLTTNQVEILFFDRIIMSTLVTSFPSFRFDLSQHIEFIPSYPKPSWFHPHKVVPPQ